MKEQFRERLLRRFVEEPQAMSRNKNFHAYLDPDVRQAARIGRIVRSLRAELRDNAVVEANLWREAAPDGPGRFVLELRFEDGRRKTWLSESELAVLLEDDVVNAALRVLLDEAEAA